MKVTETPSNTDSLANESPSSVLRRLTKFIKDLMQPSTQLGSVQKTYWDIPTEVVAEFIRPFY